MPDLSGAKQELSPGAAAPGRGSGAGGRASALLRGPGARCIPLCPGMGARDAHRDLGRSERIARCHVHFCRGVFLMLSYNNFVGLFCFLALSRLQSLCSWWDGI